MERDRNARLAYSTGGEREPEPPPSEPRRARGHTRLRLERRSGGRVVTLVTGLPGTDAEGAALGRELRTACGAGGTYKDGALELQGDQRGPVEALLRARGIPSKRAGG